MIPAQNYPLNCANVGQATNNQIKKLSLSDRRFNIVAEKFDRISNPVSSGIIQLADRNIFRTIGQSHVTDFKISSIIESQNIKPETITYTSSNTNICTINNIDTNQIASHVSNGTCIVKGTTSDGESACIKLTFSSNIGGINDAFDSWKSGSLSNHIQSFIDNIFNNLTNLTESITVIDCALGCGPIQVKIGSPMRYWKSWPGNQHLSSTGGSSGHQNINGPWIRDTSFWLYPIDFTGISQWTISNTNNSFLVRGSLITPEHCISCAHGHEPNVGDTLLFITNDAGYDQPETIIQRTVISKQKVPGCDFSISRLSSGLPPQISPFKVLPKTWFNQMIGFDGLFSIPLIRWNQDHHATVNKLIYPLTNYNGGTPFRLSFSTPFNPDPVYSNYSSKIRFLDSGNPNFLIINNEPVLVGTHSTVTGGPLIPYYYDQIESTLASLGGSTTSLTPADISGFPTFVNPFLV